MAFGTLRPDGRCPRVAARLQSDRDRLAAVPLHAVESAVVGRRRAPGVHGVVPGAAVQLDRALPDVARCAAQPGRRGPGDSRHRCRAGGGLARLAATRSEPARIGATDCVPLQFVHRAGAGRTPGRCPGTGVDGGADLGLRAAVQRGGRVAAGSPWRPRLLARAGAQPADSRHRGRLAGQCGVIALARIRHHDDATHRQCGVAARPDGRRRGSALRCAARRARIGRGVAGRAPYRAARVGGRAGAVAAPAVQRSKR